MFCPYRCRRDRQSVYWGGGQLGWMTALLRPYWDIGLLFFRRTLMTLLWLSRTRHLRRDRRP